MIGINPHETALHLAGMGQVIARRGGLDNLGLGGIVKQAVIIQSFFWLFATRSTCGIQEPASLAIPTSAPAASLAYPVKPFSPKLNSKLALLPAGLRELAQSGYLCNGLIDIVTEYQIWITRTATGMGTAETNNGRLVDSICRNYGTLSHLLHSVSELRARQLSYSSASSSSTYDGAYFPTPPPQPSLPQSVVRNRFPIHAATSLVLVLFAADIFYSSPVRVVAPKLSSRLEEIADMYLWLQDDGMMDLKSIELRKLEKKCIAWALMVAAEAGDDPNSRGCDGASGTLMVRVFEMMEIGKERGNGDGNEVSAEGAWQEFQRDMMEGFLCPWFLVREWKRCWMKYWRRLHEEKTG